jgi:hypothetical protein
MLEVGQTACTTSWLTPITDSSTGHGIFGGSQTMILERLAEWMLCASSASCDLALRFPFSACSTRFGSVQCVSAIDASISF